MGSGWDSENKKVLVQIRISRHKRTERAYYWSNKIQIGSA